MPTMATIVVGVDGSQGAAEALRWAVDEAKVRHQPVVAVMAWGLLEQHQTVTGADFDPAYGETEAMAALDKAITTALGADAATITDRRVVLDLASAALLAAAGPEDLLVVGARGLGGFTGLLVGSVSRKVLSQAHGPVAVVRPATGSTGPVVVGVDGSDTAHGALDWALDEGRARGVVVKVVHGWTAPFVGAYPFGGATFEPGLFEDSAREVLDTVLADVDTSGIEVSRELIYGTGASALLEMAAEAAVVVVGTRGLGGIKSWLLGSVSHQVVHHAPCTVVVVPHAG